MSLPPALAADGDESESLARVINADVLSLDLANAGTSTSGYPSDAGPNSDPLNIEALNALNIDVGNVSLPLIGTEAEGGLLHLGELGALSSYAASPDGQNSVASAGVVGDDGALDLDGIANGTYGSARVDLTDLLGQVGVDGLTDEIVDEVSLQLGAMGSTAEATGDDVASEYVVADGQLVISSPLVGGVSTELDTALTGVGTVLNDAVGTDGLLGEVAGAVDIDLSVPGVASIDAGGGTVGVSGLDAALEQASNTVINEPLVDSNGLVSIDLANGTIAVDLQQLGGEDGLNGLPANTELLDAATIERITGAVTEALGAVTTKAGEAVDDVLDNVGLTIEIPAEVSALIGIVTADVDIVVDTTLGQLAGTSPGEPTIEISGSLLGIPLDPILDAVVGPLVQQLINPLGDVVNGLFATATSGLTETLNAALQPVLGTLSPVLSGVLTEIVSVTINEQLEPGYLDGDSFTVNALSLQLLPNLGSGVAKIDLASSTVRANDEQAVEDPTLTAAPPSVEDGETSTVTGENYPPNTNVTVQLNDPEGNPLGDPVTATTDENGGFTADVLVPEGSEAGAYTVEGTADSGESATADLGVTNADDPTDDNTADNTTDNTEVNTEANTEVNTGENTETNTEANTEVNTGENTTDNTEVNTGENTTDNTEANTEVNTGENTEANTEVNTGENTEANTEVNTGENTEANTGENTTDNTEANTGENTTDNTEVNTEVNTADNAADNTADNAADNTAHAELDLTPNRAHEGVDKVLVQGTGYTPGADVEVHVIGMDGQAVPATAPEQLPAPKIATMAAIANPGDSIGTLTVDENGEVLFRLPSDQYVSGDYTVSVIEDASDSALSASKLFTVVPAEAADEEPGISVEPGSVEDGQSTTVTGENFPPSAEVQVQLKDSEGNPVGDLISAETDEDGSFTADLPVPAGTEAGDYIVEAGYEAEEGTQTVVAPLAVTNADGGDDNGADNTGDSQSDNTADNTGDNQSENTADNTAENTDANTDANTEVNTGDNADDGTTEPTVTVDPDTAAPGDSITVEGENFPPNSEVEVQLEDSEGNPIGDPVTVITDDEGSFSEDLVILDGTTPGDYTIVATDEGGNSASADLTVTGTDADNTAANTGDSTGGNTGDSSTGGGGLNGGGSTGNGSSGWSGGNGSGGSLAQTGAEGVAAIVGIATLLLLAGGAGLLVSRRSMR